MDASHHQFVSLLVIAVAAFAVPIALALVPRLAVPAIVGEVLAGIVLGRSGLNWIHLGAIEEFLFLFGLAFLLMLSGLEIDLPALLRPLRRGSGELPLHSPLVMATVGMVVRLVVGLGSALLLAHYGYIDSAPLIGILLTSTSMGIVLPTLHERELVQTPFGQRVLTAAAVADIVTVLLLSVFFSVEQRSTGSQLVIVALIVVTGLVAFGGLRVLGRPDRVRAALMRMSGPTVRIQLRGALALLLGFVALTRQLGVESILGAFIVGLMLGALSPGERSVRLREQLSMIGYSFFIPAFFVLAGARLDLRDLTNYDVHDLALAPLLLVLVFLAKVGTTPLLRLGGCSWRESLAGGVLQSAQLTLTVAGVEIGLQTGVIDQGLGSTLILVAACSVLIAPLVFGLLLPDRREPARPVDLA